MTSPHPASGEGKSSSSTVHISTIRTSKLVKSHDIDGNKTFNEYTLLSLVARGAYGKVKRAKKDENNFAVKIYSKSALDRKKMSLARSTVPSPLQCVQSEINILSQLNHPHILKLHEVVDDQEFDKMYLVTEWVESGSSMVWNPDAATFYFQDITFYDESVARIALTQMSSALSYLHKRSIAHHDIKPENILRCGKRRRMQQSRVGSALQSDSMSSTRGGTRGGTKGDDSDQLHFVLCDFGAAVEYSSIDEQVIATKGTHAFFAPEMCGCNPGNEDVGGGGGGGGGGEGAYSPFVSDIWALGVTLYSYVYGRLPFWDNRGVQPLFDAIVSHELETLKWRSDEKNGDESLVSASLRQLLRRMLRKDASERLTLAEVETDDWTQGIMGNGDGDVLESRNEDEDDVVSF